MRTATLVAAVTFVFGAGATNAAASSVDKTFRSDFPAPGQQHTIRPEEPSWDFGDTDGHGSVQVDFTGVQPYVVNSSYQLQGKAPALCKAGGKESLEETIDIYRDGKKVLHDHHDHEPCDYFAHPGNPKMRIGMVNSSYVMKVKEVFRFESGNAVGTATVYATANFVIRSI
jgi:hypothetical protein